MNNYKLLPSLVAILKTKNITESAKELHVSQSAMSKTLNQIRVAFQDPILIREKNSFVLTERAKELQEQLPSLLGKLDCLYQPTTLDLVSCDRLFNLASSDYVAQFILPEICQSMSAESPNARIEYQLWQNTQLTKLADLEIDLVSTITDSVPENLHGKKMAEDELVIVMNRIHPLAVTNITLNDYINAQHIAISGGGDKDSLVNSALTLKNKTRDIFATVPFFQSAVELLMKTNTLLTTPLHIAADFAHHHDIVIKPLPLSIKPHQYYVLWHAKHHHDPEHKWFREMCYQQFTSHLDKTITHGMSLLNQNN